MYLSIMNPDVTGEEIKKLTPELGFNLCGIDYFESLGNRLYLIEHYEKYQDALESRKKKDNPNEYMILYSGAPE